MIPRARLDTVTEADIQDLIDHGVRESRTLDYKRDWPADRDARTELAKDVCAFANSLGGDLLFGMREDEGAAAEIVPLRFANLDADLLALTSALRDLLEPRVSGGLHAHPVPLAAGGHVIVLRVAPSPAAPHRVTRDNHFYARTSVGKEPMDIHGIRNAFAFSDSVADRVLEFRSHRITRLSNREGPRPLQDAPVIACHVVPVSAITRRDAHSVEALLQSATVFQGAEPLGVAVGRSAVNYEGVVVSSGRDEQDRYFGYVQLFRNGCIEIAAVCEWDQRGNPPRPTLFPFRPEHALVRRGFRRITEALATLEVNAPVYVFVSWLNVHGMRVCVRREAGHDGFPALPEHLQDIIGPPVYLEDFEGNPADVLAPALDVLWNAVGIAHTRTDFAAAD